MSLTRRSNDFLQAPIVIGPITVAAATADATVKVWKNNTGRSVRINAVSFNSPTGLAQDGTNYFTLKLLNGTDVAASWSTQTTTGNGSIPANSFVDLVLSATDAFLVVAPDGVLSIFSDESGDTTLPVGVMNIAATEL